MKRRSSGKIITNLQWHASWKPLNISQRQKRTSAVSSLLSLDDASNLLWSSMKDDERTDEPRAGRAAGGGGKGPSMKRPKDERE